MCFPGMTLALFLYMGHIPRIFSRNLLYSQKTRFRVPKGDKGEKKKIWKKLLFYFFALYLHFTKTNFSVFLLEKKCWIRWTVLSFFSWNRIWANVLRNSVSSHHLSGKNKNKTAYRHLKEMTHLKNYNCTEKNKLKILNSALPKSIQYLWWKGTVSFFTASRAGQQLGAVCILSSTSCRRHRLFWFFVFGLIFRRRPWTCGSKTEKQLHWQYDIMLKKTKICFLNV